MRILFLGKNIENAYAASWYYMLRQLFRTQDLVTHGPTQSLRSRWIPNLDYGFATPLMKIYSRIDGLRTVKKHHTVEIREKQFIRYLKAIK